MQAAVLGRCAGIYALFRRGGVGLGCGKKSSEKPYEAYGVEFELGRYKDALRVKYAVDQGYQMTTTWGYVVKGNKTPDVLKFYADGATKKGLSILSAEAGNNKLSAGWDVMSQTSFGMDIKDKYEATITASYPHEKYDKYTKIEIDKKNRTEG